MSTALRVDIAGIDRDGFKVVEEDGETLVLKCNPNERDLLIETAPQTFFLTDHYRGYP